MSHREIQELLGAYALDAVEGQERDEVADHLRVCDACLEEVTGHREVAALLAWSGGTAPAAGWVRLAEAIAVSPTVQPIATVTPLRRRWVQPVVLTGAAAAVVLVIATLGMRVTQAERTIAEMQAAQATPRDPLARTFELESARAGAVAFELRTTGSVLLLPGTLTATGRAYLDLTALPALPADQTYQLWGVVEQGRTSLGSVGTNPGIVAFEPLLFRQLAVTVEKAPGATESRRRAIASGGIAS